MTISKEKYKCLKTMTNDLMEAEYFINSLGIKTRTDSKGDEFRTIKDILNDVVLVCRNNPTILEDCSKFLASSPTSTDENDRFLRKYNLNGIYRIID